jgi:hypothetical protein
MRRRLFRGRAIRRSDFEVVENIMISDEVMKKITEQEEIITRRFEQAKNLDSSCFVEIPEVNIINSSDYRTRLVREIETQWMRDFNGNGHYYPDSRFYNLNDFSESGISGEAGGIFIGHCKLYRHDGSAEPWGEDDYRAKRGLMLRDHYSKRDVGKVHFIVDNLVDFLIQENIPHKRIDFEKRF